MYWCICYCFFDKHVQLPCTASSSIPFATISFWSFRKLQNSLSTKAIFHQFLGRRCPRIFGPFCRWLGRKNTHLANHDCRWKGEIGRCLSSESKKDSSAVSWDTHPRTLNNMKTLNPKPQLSHGGFLLSLAPTCETQPCQRGTTTTPPHSPIYRETQHRFLRMPPVGNWHRRVYIVFYCLSMQAFKALKRACKKTN